MRYTPTEIESTYAAITALNSNFAELAALLEKCVFTDGTAPNSMEADFDMNNFKIRNVSDAVNPSDAVNLSQIQSITGTPGPKGDPGSPGEGYATRTALAARSSPALFDDVYLTEKGREGKFVVDDASLWTDAITADTLQGLFIVSTTDATKVYRRLFSGHADLRWWGIPLKGDATAVGTGTDVSSAYNCAFATLVAMESCSAIAIPYSKLGYRISSTLKWTAGVFPIGFGWHENPGNVNGTSYPFPQNLRGSILVFDTDVPGMQFIDFTDNAANATAFEFEGARYSPFQNLALVSSVGTNPDAHGVESRTVFFPGRVRVEGFSGDGVHISASTTGSDPYGNASGSSLTDVHILANGCHGLHIKGIDASAINTWGGSIRNNGGAGVLDETHIGGNNFDGINFATNNQSFGTSTPLRTRVIGEAPQLADQTVGSIVITNSSTTPHTVAKVYSEGGVGSKAHLPAGTLLLGGILGQINSNLLTSASRCAIIDPSGKLRFESLDTWGGTFNITGNLGVSQAASICQFSLSPGTSTYSEIQMKGSGGLLANGLDILAGNAAAYFSSDSIVLRNSAQNVTYATFQGSGLNLGSGINIKINGTQVVSARKTGWTVDTGTAKRTANATYTAGTALTYSASYVQAEQTATGTRLAAIESALQDLSQTMKALKDDLHFAAGGHGLIGS